MKNMLLCIITITLLGSSFKTLTCLENIEEIENGESTDNGTWADYGDLLTILDSEVKTVDSRELGENIEDDDGTTKHVILVEADAKKIKAANECDDPPPIENAEIIGKRQSTYAVGDEATYACVFGYATVGTIRTAQCTFSERGDSPQWIESDITCTARSCGDPGFVVNAHRVGSLFTFPNKVNFECEEGYELIGNGIRYCKTTGKWSGSLPKCETLSCESPESPTNGRVSYSSLEYGSQLQYSCDSGFLLKQHQTRVCSSNGTWSGDEPVCQESGCSPPVAPEHGAVQVVGGSFRVDSMALYTCEGNRVLSGSATSKCLDIGEWTFPAPDCLDPCSVPSVANGKIGRYVSTYSRRQKQLNELPAGSAVKDGEDLYVICQQNYEPLGKASVEEKVICREGVWSAFPRCEPARCRGLPPPTVNGRAGSVDRSHGGITVYFCKSTHFRKAASGNITCHFGNWIGITPVCKDTRCNIKQLAFRGIQRIEHEYFQSGEKFTVACKKGYYQVKPDSQLNCNDGSWKGHLPPCAPANCSGDPPLIENGAVGSFLTFHSSVVSYKCDEFFVLTDDASYKVQCLFGEWTGRLPTCKDSRCYSKDLAKGVGTATGGDAMAYSGEFLPTICGNGFISNGIDPFCSEGIWQEPAVPCLESACTVSPINKGELTTKQRMQKWNLWPPGYNYWDEYRKVTIGESKQPGSTLYTTCISGYSFQGKWTQNILVTCTRGEWHPTPLCLPNGTPYMPEEKAQLADNKQLTQRPITRLTQPTTKQPAVSTPSPFFEPRSAKVPNNANSEQNCFCEFLSRDQNLVAHAGSELLQFGSKVKNNCSVKFHCHLLGYYRLQGSAEITCKDCRTWQSTEYPQCVKPGSGDTVLMFEEDKSVLPGGSVGMKQGETIRITCFANGISEYPEWRTPVAPNIKLTSNNELYQSVLEIKDASPGHSGRYECSVGTHRSSTIEIQVVGESSYFPSVKCPKLPEIEGLLILYDQDHQTTNSSAIFTCREQNRKLVGSNVLTCLSNGQWSGHPPACLTTCPTPIESEGLAITLSRGVDVGSIATFHCFPPSQISGVSQTHCNRKGEWAHPMPTCSLASCDIDDLFSMVPEGIVPLMDGVSGASLPFNFSLSLTCDASNSKLIGSEVATCGKDGTWIISQVHCVPGCPVLEIRPGSGLAVEPPKIFYRIGEFITLSCAPGQVLSTELVRLMCLGGGWSESEIPYCVEGQSEETTTLPP